MRTLRRSWHAPGRRHPRMLLGGALLVVLTCAMTLTLASRRIAAEQAAFSLPAAGRCVPITLNQSAVLPGTSLAVTPLPGSYDALPRTQISLLGAPSSAIGKVVVRGSSSGRHAGRLRAYSQGDGASFVPRSPFRSGETVTVRGIVSLDHRAQRFSFQFVIASEDALPHPAVARPPGDYNQTMHFHSRPDLEPPAVVVDAHSSDTSPGYVFTAPYKGPGRAGPMIFDEAGNLVWFSPLSPETDSRQPAGPEPGGQAGPHLVAGLRPAAGVRAGRRDRREQLLRADRQGPRGQRIQDRPSRLPPHSRGDRDRDGLQPDPLRPLGARRPARRRGHRQPLPGSRPAHGARSQGVAQRRPRPDGRFLQHARHTRARDGPSTSSTSTRSTSWREARP